MPGDRLPSTLTFLGAAGTVTGSKYLLQVGTRRVLFDAGLFQGPKELRLRNWERFPVDPATISDVVLTHAHLDHAGYLPALVRNGFTGPIWCTNGTRELAEIVLYDAAKLQEQDARDANEMGYSKHSPALPLYTAEDVDTLLPHLEGLDYDTDVELTGNARAPFQPNPDERVTIRLTRAAHILGSASVNVWTPDAAVLLSGDLGRHDHPVLKPRETPPGAPIVLIESTYGDREHPEPDGPPHEGFADVIRRTIARGGTVLVPAFAVDRTEIVLKTISDMEREGRIPDVPVYVNSPMGVRALKVYQKMTDELRDDMRPEDFVAIPDLKAVESVEGSKALTAPGGHGPSVIISASGMATGGRVLHHLEQLLPDPKNAVVLAGYQSVGTRGRQLSDGQSEIKIRGRYIPVRAEIYHDREFSVHADCSDLLDWLRDLTPPPAQVFCVHGEPAAAASLVQRIHADLGLDAVVPRHGEVIRLDEVAAAPPPAARQPVTGTPETPAVAPTAGDAEVVHRSAGTGAGPSPAGATASGSPTPTVSAGAAGSYRLLTGRGDELDRLVNAALAEGYELHGDPAVALDGEQVVAVQAVVRRGDQPRPSTASSAAETAPSDPPAEPAPAGQED